MLRSRAIFRARVYALLTAGCAVFQFKESTAFVHSESLRLPLR